MWPLGGPGLGQIQRIAGPVLGATYGFRLYSNLNVIPEACAASGITAASAMRYEGAGTARDPPPLGILANAASLAMDAPILAAVLRRSTGRTGGG